MSSGSEEVSAGLVDNLLSLPTLGEQTTFLRAEGLLDAGGLDRLLDAAERLLNDDPGKARELAELCAGLAKEADAPAAVPRASYVRAGAHNINGEFALDLRLTEAAYEGYAALGMDLEALRTNAGKMDALLELGRYGDALDAGRLVLDALDGKGGLRVSPTREQARFLAGLVHQNRGLCYEYMGRYDEALAAYALAEELYEDLGMVERVGDVLDNRGAILLSLGRGSEALAARETAADIFSEAGLTLSFAKALVNMGQVHLQLGNYARSLDAFEQTRRLLSSLDALADQHLLLRDTADAYLSLNLNAEALTAYREAADPLRNAGMTHDLAQVLWGMGSALTARSEYGAAEQALDEAAALFEETGNVPLLSGVMLEQASLLAARGDRGPALETAYRALELVRGEGWPVQRLYAHMRIADLLLPEVAEVEPHLREAQRLVDRLALPQLRYRLDERLGRLRRLQERPEEALDLLEGAIDELERSRGTVAQDALRVSFMQDRTAAYEELLRLHLAREDEDGARRAFAVAERAKSRALVDLLTGVAEKGPTDSELGGRARTLQADLNAIYSELLGGSGDGGGPAYLANLRARAVELEQEISRLRLQAAASEPGPFSTSAPPDLIQGRLPTATSLVAYHLVGDEIIAFVNTDGRIRIALGLGTATGVNGLLGKLSIQWDRFRAGRGFAERNMALLERSTRQALAALYDELVAPLEPLLRETAPASDKTGPVPRLAVVPHGPLHQVPFHALFDGQRYLIERFEISYAPSAVAYALCQNRGTRTPEGAAVFGVEDPLIPAVGAEARAVAQQLPGAELRVGEDATVEALRGAAPRSGILHLACHGLFRSDNPMFSALQLHDGWLVAADAISLSLSDALVTLSACESGRAEVIGGDEILGLTRAFLGAGAATLVVSLWLVQDETTAELMSEWYRRLRDRQDRAAALREAQLELKERYPHPYFWAPFVLIGKR